MLRIDILTIFPEMFQGVFNHSILKRAIEKQKASVYFHQIRDYTTDKHHRVDDYQYGGGAGLVMTIQPITDCIDKLRAERHYDEIIFMTPDGEVFNQNTANHLSTFANIIILCGHYKGIDNRIREHYITKEISVGDYVLTGGELAAAIVCDAVIRLIPGVLNDETSALTDSFQNNLLSAPVYSRPAEYKGMKVPDILLSGNEKVIDAWRHQQSIEKTQARRPDLLEE